MKNQNYSSRIIALFSIAFAFVCLLATAQNANAQRLSGISNGSEARGIAQFANDLSDFLTQANLVESENSSNPANIKKLELLGKKVKDGTSNLRSNLKGLVTSLKNQNRWDDNLDTEINDLFGSRKIKGFFQRNGGRKILTDAEGAINALNADVDTIISNAGKRRASASFGTENSGRKFKVKCVVLGVAIFGAELARAKQTAENLDGFFDKSCGAGATTAT
jgi:hypothetical protein